MITASKIISIGFLSMGVFILMQVILPILTFQVWWYTQKFNNQILISPKQNSSQILGVSVRNKDNFPVFYSTLTRQTKPNYDRFIITIPKLKIEKSDVFVDSNDLSKGLAHLPGSALPGEKGNVFLSGHSAVSIFADKNAIFAKLADLKKGDEILVEAGGTRFTYQVVEIKVVDPADLSVIPAPESQGRYISLMTCVPPGLNFKRMIVLGKMI